MRAQLLLLGIGIASVLYGAAAVNQKDSKLSVAEQLFAHAKPDDYMGNEGCADCHAETVAAFAQSPHAAYVSDPKLPLEKRGCEGCHGPGYVHRADANPQVISFTKMTPQESAAACLRCHAQTMSPTHWRRSAHSQAGLSCVSCHQIHPDVPNDLQSPLAQKADARKPAFIARKNPSTSMLKADELTLCGSCHASRVNEFRKVTHHPVPEGRMLCTDCHNAHPTKGLQLTQDSNKQMCVTCHVEKSGPFAYEHEPVAGNMGGDGCLVCHSPHGSNNPLLLNSFSRGLCGQCHVDKLSNHHPGLTCWSAGCHVAPHGSNTDPRFLAP